jgi:hypothetical protein
VTGANGLQEIRQSLSTGALAPTEIRALPSTKVLTLHATEIEAQPDLSIGVLDLYVMEAEAPANLSTETLALHVMETGTLRTKAPSDPSEASALSTTMCQ